MKDIQKPSDQSDLTLKQYARVVARCIGVKEQKNVDEIVRSFGIDSIIWKTEEQKWTKKLSKLDQSSSLSKQYIRLLIKELTEICGDVKCLSFDEHVSITVDAHTGKSLDEIAASLNQDLHTHYLVGYKWMEKLEKDPCLKAHFQLRVRKECAEKAGHATHYEQKWRPGSTIRARRCSGCGAFKVTRPKSAYIYCDFCGTLFDYDLRVIHDNPTALNPDDVDTMLDQTVGESLAKAFKANDRDKYAEITRWRIKVFIDVCPHIYSPRMQDTVYRRQMIDDVLIPWRIATRFNAEYMGLRRKIHDAEESTEKALLEYKGMFNIMDSEKAKPEKLNKLKKRGKDELWHLLEVSKKLWHLEADILKENGIFEKHPDQLTRDLFLYVTASAFVRPWLSLIEKDIGFEFLEAAGVASEYVELPPMEIEDRSCVQCGKPIKVPTNATRTMCEHCGFMLESNNRSLTCSQCGALFAMPIGATRKTEVNCAFCKAVWKL
jgi:hypothetical protein